MSKSFEREVAEWVALVKGGEGSGVKGHTTDKPEPSRQSDPGRNTVPVDRQAQELPDIKPTMMSTVSGKDTAVPSVGQSFTVTQSYGVASREIVFQVESNGDFHTATFRGSADEAKIVGHELSQAKNPEEVKAVMDKYGLEHNKYGNQTYRRDKIFGDYTGADGSTVSIGFKKSQRIAKGGSGSGRYPKGSTHTVGTLSGEAVRLSNYVMDITGNLTPNRAQSAIGAHETMADLHEQLAQAMAGDERAVQANLKAADAHYKAAATIANKMGEWAQPSTPQARALAGYGAPKATIAQVKAASKAATTATIEAQKLSQQNEDDKIYIGGSLPLTNNTERGIFDEVVAKGGPGSGRYPAGSRLAINAVIQNLGVNDDVFADRTLPDSDAHFALAKDHLEEAGNAPTAELNQAHIRAAIAHQEAGRAHADAERIFARGTRTYPGTETRVWDLRNGDESAYLAHEQALSSARKATEIATLATLEATGQPLASDLTEALSMYGIDSKMLAHAVGKDVSNSATLAYKANQMEKSLESDFEPTPTPVKDLVLSLADQMDNHLSLVGEHTEIAERLLDKANTTIGVVQAINKKLLEEAAEAHTKAGRAHLEAYDAIASALPVDYYSANEDELEGVSDARLTDFRLDDDEMQQIREAANAVALANEASSVALGATASAHRLSYR